MGKIEGYIKNQKKLAADIPNIGCKRHIVSVSADRSGLKQ